MESPTEKNPVISLLFDLPRILRKGSKFALSIIWQVEVFETALKAGFITEMVPVQSLSGVISTTELRMECSHRNCGWNNTIKLDSKNTIWIVDNASSLALCSHTHSISPIPSGLYAEANVHLREIQLEKGEQLKNFIEKFEGWSSFNGGVKKARNAGVAIDKKLLGEPSDKLNGSEVNNSNQFGTIGGVEEPELPFTRRFVPIIKSKRSRDELPGSPEKKAKKFTAPVKKAINSPKGNVESTFNINLLDKKGSKLLNSNISIDDRSNQSNSTTSRSTQTSKARRSTKPIYKKPIYDLHLSAALDGLMPDLGKSVDAFVEVGIRCQHQLGHVIDDFSEKELEILRLGLVGVTHLEPLSIYQSLAFVRAVREQRE